MTAAMTVQWAGLQPARVQGPARVRAPARTPTPAWSRATRRKA